MFRGETLQSFYNLGYALLVLALLAWLLFNILAPAYVEDQFFTNPSFFAALIGAKYHLILSAFLSFFAGALFYGFLEFVRHRQLLNFLTRPYSLIEVRLPDQKEYPISMMELFFETIYISSGEGNWYKKWVQGKTRPVYSFEIVSQGGVVRFFIRARANMRDVITTAIYTYYPDAQIIDVDDYTLDVLYDTDKWSLWGVEWNLARQDALPIKSYADFVTEKTPKDSAPLDPMAPLFEIAGTLTGNEKLWLQFIARTEKYARPPEQYETQVLKREYWEQKKISEEVIDEIMAFRKKQADALKDSELKLKPDLTDSEKRLVATGGRISEKGVFEIGMRMLYLAPHEECKETRIPSFLNAFRLTQTATNALVPSGRLLEEATVFPEKTEKPGRIEERDVLLRLYRDRMFWFAPAVYRFSPASEDEPSVTRKTMLMSTEILATICHFPTTFVRTPTVQRTLARTGESPENLPT